MTTILLDIDGVTHDWVSAVLKALQPWGCPVRYQDVIDYDIRACLPKHLHEPLSRLPYQEGFCRSIPLYAGATQFIRALRTEGRVIALTKASPGPFWRAERHEALSNLGFRAEDIAIVERHEDKHDYPGDVLIEDNPETIFRSKHRHKYLVARPWNSREKETLPHRVHTYGHLHKRVRER